MARLSLLTFVALALSSIASGAPTPDGVNEEAKQNFQYCGSCALASPGPACVTQLYPSAGGTGDIISVTTSPDTPDRGVQFSVTVVASTPAEIVVSRPSDCDKWGLLTVGFSKGQPSTTPPVMVVQEPSIFAMCMSIRILVPHWLTLLLTMT